MMVYITFPFHHKQDFLLEQNGRLPLQPLPKSRWQNLHQNPLLLIPKHPQKEQTADVNGRSQHKPHQQINLPAEEDGD